MLDNCPATESPGRGWLNSNSPQITSKRRKRPIEPRDERSRVKLRLGPGKHRRDFLGESHRMIELLGMNCQSCIDFVGLSGSVSCECSDAGKLAQLRLDLTTA